MKEMGRWWGRIGVTSIAVHMFIEAVGRKSIFSLFVYMKESLLVFLLNTLMIALPFVLLFFTVRKYFVLVCVAFLWMAVGAVNGFLLTFRTTPFTAADLRLVKYGFALISTYMSWPQMIGCAAGLIIVVGLCLMIWKKAPVEKQKVYYPTSVCIGAFSVALVLFCVAGSMKSGLVAVHFGNIGQAYQDYGFAYCFSSSLFNTGIARPKTYDSETVAMINDGLAPANTYALQENKTPNIIMVQLESFFDPLLYRNYSFQEDPIPFFRYIRKKYPSGYLNVPSVGAGTANTEFECITGMNLDFFGPGEYPYKTVLQKTTCESTAFDLKNLGYKAHAIHNNEATFYDRHKVFAQLGFDTFTPIEYMYDVERNPTGWCKDEILTREIVKALNSTKGQDFIYTITVQGHGAYPGFEYYGEQIHEMDNFIKKLVYTLSIRNEPSVVVFYGDHLPGFSWEPADMGNHSLYQTPYVIWNNMGLPKVNREIEAYQLSSHVLNMLDIHEGTMIRFHQKYLKERGNEEEYLENMQMLEYDILYGEQEIYGGESPYKTTDLQMGIMPIQVDQIVYKDSNLLIFGENFNPYSKVCIDDKALETMYVWPQLIIAKNVPEKKVRDKDAITVKQIGRDKIVLGEAEKTTIQKHD